MKKQAESSLLKQRLVQAANMPSDVVLGAALVHVLGTHEACIENYRGIIEYTDALVRIQTKECQIRINGASLKIDYYTNDEMKVTGTICSIEFCK